MELEKDKDLATWDLGKIAGTDQTEEAQSAINDKLINNPNEKIGGTGESFNEFQKRVLDCVRHYVKIVPPNIIIVTHNTVFGLIKLWDKMGRPETLDKEFREIYSKQDSEPSDSFTIKNEKDGKVYVVRHGETEDNKDGKFRTDEAKLTPKGEAQAERLGRKFKNIRVPKIISSPLHRAVETANIIIKDQSRERPVKKMINATR
jgi:broad specificity phosphatase PhoE